MREEVVLDAGEFVEMMSACFPEKSDVADAFEFVRQAMRLQNDAGRPVYVLSFSDSMTWDDVRYVRECMDAAGVAAVLVPESCLSYVATLTPESMRASGDNIRENLRRC